MVKISFDQALTKFMDVFLELHPKETWPSWFRSCTTYGGTEDSDGNWRFSFSAISKGALGEDDIWEKQANGNFAQVRVDKVTGEKKVIISNTSKEAITLFEALINLSSGEVSVTVDRDFSKVDGSMLLRHRRR